MTVAELVKLLEKMPKNLPVLIGAKSFHWGQCSAYCEFNSVEVEADGQFVSLEYY